MDHNLFHKAFNEKQQINLYCRPPVEKTVTWSLERNGNKTDILTSDGEGTKKHIKGTSKIYDSAADGSFFILKAEISDSGKYFCNNKPAVDVTVIPSGTIIKNVEKGKNITLDCPFVGEESHEPTWSREVAGKSEPLRSPVPVVVKKLRIRKAQLRDFGLYYCDGKPAVYLNVTKDTKHDAATQRTPRTTTVTTMKTTTATSPSPPRTTTPTTTKASASSTPQTSASPPGTTNGRNTHQEKYFFISLLVKSGAIILLTIITLHLICRCRPEIQGVDKQSDLYDDVMADKEPGASLTHDVESYV
uniref:Uncharacterized protein LOC106528688 n=1 Tax=Austrofundulus limnaeus TaxID=52670 RepID=A0A2I4CHA5_AUSLI